MGGLQAPVISRGLTGWLDLKKDKGLRGLISGFIFLFLKIMKIHEMSA